MSQGAPVPAVHALPDGRRLTWYEFGDPAGRPVIHTAGTPESGLAGACYHEAAHQAGLRWISPDKPGYGGSDFQPGRRLLDWAGDVASLADHLGLGQFSVAGESGGGPSTLALAHQLGERIRVVALLAAMGPPGDARSRVGMRRGIRAMFWLARHAPALLVVPLTAMSRTLPGPARRGRHPRRGQAEPATDALAGQHPELRGRIDAAIDAFRQGPRGAAQELTLLSRPWGFQNSDISTPVHLWHGALDTNVPISAAHRLARELPRASTHFSDTAGHSVGYERRHEVMALLAAPD